MLDDFTPIIHDLGGRTISVWAVADVHVGSKECDLEGFSAFLRRVLNDDDSYIVCCGDLINNGVKDSLTNVYDEVMPPSSQVSKVVELLRPLVDAGKVLGFVGGNHEARSRKSVDLDPGYTICCMLGVPELYRQNMAFVRIRLSNGKAQDTYSLLLMHGKSANKKRQFSYSLEGIDALITGHTHDGIVEKPTRLVFTQKGRIEFKTLVSVTATSWLKYGGYGAAAMYAPKATSDPQRLELRFVNSHNAKGKISVSW